jgi:hypothetical protein
MGGKKTARIARKISELHMVSEGRGGQVAFYVSPARMRG